MVQLKILVDWMFCQSCLKCPFGVASDLWRCVRTNLEVRPSQVAKYLASMALVQV